MEKNVNESNAKLGGGLKQELKKVLTISQKKSSDTPKPVWGKNVVKAIEIEKTVKEKIAEGLKLLMMQYKVPDEDMPLLRLDMKIKKLEGEQQYEDLNRKIQRLKKEKKVEEKQYVT